MDGQVAFERVGRAERGVNMARYQPNTPHPDGVASDDDPAFAGDYIEFSDSWSRAQVRAAWESIPATADGGDDEPLLRCLRPKIIALHLTCVDAPPITNAADLTPTRTEQMDTRLYQWFAGVWVAHLRYLSDLGNALGRRLRDTSVTLQATTTPPTARHRRRKA